MRNVGQCVVSSPKHAAERPTTPPPAKRDESDRQLSLLTKSDKLSASNKRTVLDGARAALLADWGIHADRIGVQLFSATDRAGIAEAEGAVGAWLTHAPTA